MVKYRFRPNKKLGQNFIVNQRIIKKMVNSAELTQKDRVLEIGSGTGFLTRKLLEKSRVIAVEKDEKLCELLEKELPQENLELVCGDYLREKIPEYNKVVSFPPYFISKKTIQKILKEKPSLGVLVFQREFAEKLRAFPGFLNYIDLSVLIQYYYRIDFVARVKAKNFFPKPRSDSQIIKLQKLHRQKKAVNEEGFACFVKQLFRHKNKNLSNALSDSQKFLKNVNLQKNYIEKAKYLDLGSEKVMLSSVEDLVNVFNSLHKKN